MGSNSVGDADHHAISIWEVDKVRLASMQQRISVPPSLLSEWAGRSSCCVFRAPQSFVDINGPCYQPHVVSIGPYHHGQPHLQMIQEHKWRYLGTLLKRTTHAKGLGLEDYLKAVQPHEMKARECYSETIHFGPQEFVEMLVLDGCFILELFRRIAGVVAAEADDPLFSMSWVYSFFLRDLVRLENQIPFFILQCLFDLTKIDDQENDYTVPMLTLCFYNYILPRPEEVIARHSNLHGRHLLDFLRSSFIPEDDEAQPRRDPNSTPAHLIPCISKLRRAGIKLKPGGADSFLVVKFNHGVMEMPSIAIDDFMSAFMLNCVAYEQCQKGCSKHVTTYATLLDSLVNTSKDVEYLCDRQIIENYFGTDTEVAKFINNLGKDVSFDVDNCYLSRLFNEVNEYYRNGWHVQWASFRYTYFDTPWSFISALAAFVLLILTLAQTYFTVAAYFQDDRDTEKLG